MTLLPSFARESRKQLARGGSETSRLVQVNNIGHEIFFRGHAQLPCLRTMTRLPAVDTLKRYSKALEYEYRVKTAALDTLKRYSILSLTLYLE
jgi:hypothetical protein